MIDVLKRYIAQSDSAAAKTNKVREALQLSCLKIIQDKGYFGNIAFVGGTALRLLYGTRRFSEDLDFSLIEKKGYDFRKSAAAITREFGLLGLQAEGEPRAKKTVLSCMLKFPGVMKELGISAIEAQKLSIKLEVDSNPPPGWAAERSLINNIYMININHFDLPSLFATKLHACFFRDYIKGRDFYDLVWYLGKKIRPNYVLLNNAIEQTEGANPGLGDGTIGRFLLERIGRIDLAAARKDVERFLEDKSELNFIDKDIIAKSVHDIFKT
jgi:predicted nucleotidyltransferase component of viral defense system